MKVLFLLSSAAAGGAEIYAKDLAFALRKTNVEVHIGFLDHAEDVGRDKHFESNFLSELKNSGISYFFVGHSARRNLMIGVLRVRRYVKANRIDLYHSHLKYGVVFGVLIDIPRVYTHHNIRMGSGCIWPYISNRLVEQYVGISRVCSVALAEYVKRDVETIYNGVSKNRLKHNPSGKRLGDGEIKLIAVGRIQVQKNYELMLEAISILPEPILSRLQLLIAGEGDPRYANILKNMALSLGISQNVIFLGNRTDIANLLAESDLFVMSSSWEGFPIALLEATMSGLPSVVTSVGGCAEIIESCDSGILVQPGSAREFASAIESLLSDSDMYAKFSEQALDRSQNFTIEASAMNHREIYDSLLISGKNL